MIRRMKRAPTAFNSGADQVVECNTVRAVLSGLCYSTQGLPSDRSPRLDTPR